MKLRFQIILLLVLIFLVFFPTLSAELITGDDEDLFGRLQIIDRWDLGALVIKKGSSLVYYRPFTILTYHFDKIYWHLNTAVMHLENILLHTANAVLVFFLVRAFLAEDERQRSLLPLVAALLFGLHPLTAESVNWISGRTDLLAGFFVLLSALAIVYYRHQGRLHLLVLACGFFAFGMLSKEVAVAFLPGACCMLFFANTSEPSRLLHEEKFQKKQAWWLGLWLSVALGGFLFLRFVVQAKSSGKLGLTLKIITGDLWYALFVCLRALAFYAKKIIWPFPLNFVIIEVDPLYELLAIPLLFFCLYLLWKRTRLGSLILTGVFLITPSFLIAFNQIAWTPYAERYLYLPCAFIVPGLILALGKSLPPKTTSLLPAILLVLVIGMGGATLARAFTWRSNLALWGDSVQKSPLSSAAWNDYGVALDRSGRLAEARASFERASKLTSVDYNPKHGINHAVVLMKLQDPWGAKAVLETVLERTKGKSKKAREGLIVVTEKLVEQTDQPDRKNALLSELATLKSENP